MHPASKFSSSVLSLDPVICETERAAWSPLEASQAKCSHYVTLTSLLGEERGIFQYVMGSMYNLLFQSILAGLCHYFGGGRKGGIVRLFCRQNDV